MGTKITRNKSRAKTQTTVTLSLSIDLRKEFELAASREQRSLSQLFSLILRGYLDREFEARKNNEMWNAVVFSTSKDKPTK